MLIDGNSPEKWLVVLDFIDKKLLCDPLLKKDIWHTINDMDANVNQHDKRLRISFENIQQDWLKLLVKLYILMENNRKIGVSTLTREVYCLSRFSKFINDKSIFIPNHINDQVFDEFDYHLKMSNLSQGSIAGYYNALRKFFNLCREAVRRKMYQITTQYGECHRPILKSPCQTVNACLRCEYWLTSNKDLSALKQDIQRIEVELDIACKSGMIRQQQGLTTDRQNLMIRIEGLEKVNDKS